MAVAPSPPEPTRTLSELLQEYINILVYSPAGHGKTVLIGTIVDDPRLCPGLLLDFEGGTKSIRSRCDFITVGQLRAHTPNPKKLTVVRIKSWEDFNEIYDFLVDNPMVYRTVAIDSLTEVHYLNLNTVIGVAVEVEGSSKKHDPDVAEQRDYLKSLNQMRKLIRYFRDLDMHCIFTATTMTGNDPRTTREKAVPALIGKLSGELPGLVDTVGYLALIEDEKTKKDERVLLLAGNERFTAKCRMEGEPIEQLERPTMPKLLDLLIPEPEPTVVTPTRGRARTT